MLRHAEGEREERPLEGGRCCRQMGEDLSHSTRQRRWTRRSVSTFISSSWYSCFSQQFKSLLPLSCRVSPDSPSSFRPYFSIISSQHSYCIPITTSPCHAVAKSWVLSCLVFPSVQLRFPAATNTSTPNLPSVSSTQRCFPPQLCQSTTMNNPCPHFLHESKSSLALVPLHPHSAPSRSLALLWVLSPSLFL